VKQKVWQVIPITLPTRQPLQEYPYTVERCISQVILRKSLTITYLKVQVEPAEILYQIQTSIIYRKTNKINKIRIIICLVIIIHYTYGCAVRRAW